jgi:alkylhydroperoxidase family enzyme
MTYVQNPAAGPTELDRVYGLRDAYYQLFMQDYNRSIERVDPVLIELCRLSMARLLGSKLDLSLRYEPAADAGLMEEKLRELSNYYKSPLFTDRERRCIGFAEQFVLQSSEISDDDVKRVQEVLGPEEFIYFVKALSVMDQLQRGCSALRIESGKTAPATMPNFRSAAPTLQ